MKNLIGTTLHQYQILVKIRETGTRVLYRAYDARTHQHVGLDVIKIHCAEPAALLNLLKDQAKKNAKLTHPNIAEMVDSGIHEGMIYLVYNFHPQHPLRRFFNRTYSWNELARELVAVTQAVAYAHEAGICHGALNPNSIILSDKRNPVLFDFGFEQVIKDFTLAHSPGSWINKWGYEFCPPEQLNGEPPDPRSDVYAMGMIVHDWIKGEIALLEPTPLDTLRKRIFQSDGKKADKETPPAIQTLIEKCIAVDPKERYQSMQEVGLILARGALDLTITKSMVRKPLSMTAARPRANRSALVLGLVAVLVIAGALAWGVGSGFLSRDGSVETVTATRPIPTPSKTLKPTSTPAPTQESESPAPAVTAPPSEPTVSITYPLFQETPITSIDQVIRANNVRQLVPVSLWGIGDLNDLTTSPDGKYVAAGTSRGVFVFEPGTLKLEQHIDTYSWVSVIAFSPDSKTIVAGDQDGLIRTWSTESWQEILEKTYSGHTNGILDLAFSPDGTRLASVGLDNKLFQWQVGSGNDPKPTPAQVMGVSSVTYSSDGRYIVTGDSFFKINVWDANNLASVRSFTFTSKVVDLAGIADSSSVVVGGSDQRVALIDIDGGTGVVSIGSLQYPLARVAASSNGETITGADVNGGLIVWNREGSQLWKVPSAAGSSGITTVLGSLHSLSFSPDGKTLFSGLRNGTLRALDVATGQKVQENQSLDAHVNRFMLSNSDQYLISQHNDSIIKVWDVRNSKLMYQLQGEIKTDNPFSMSDRYIAIASDPTTVKVLTTLKGEEVHTFNGHQSLETIRFVHGDNYLAAGNDKDIHLWSMTSGQELKTRINFSGSGCSIYFDLKDNPILSITSYQHIVEDSSNASLLCGFQKLDFMKAFHIDEAIGRLAYGGNSQLFVQYKTSQKDGMEGVNLHNVVSAAISPAGNLLAAAYDDNTIHIWDISARQEVMSLFGHSGSITDLRFTSDGTLLISASLDGTIRLWGVP
jgi:WD40 repeat protein